MKLFKIFYVNVYKYDILKNLININKNIKLILLFKGLFIENSLIISV